MAKNRLVNREQRTFSIDKKLLKFLDDLHEETTIPKTKLVDKALVLLAKEYNKDIDKDIDTK